MQERMRWTDERWEGRFGLAVAAASRGEKGMEHLGFGAGGVTVVVGTGGQPGFWGAPAPSKVPSIIGVARTAGEGGAIGGPSPLN